MKFSVNWLRDFVELPESVDEIVHALVMIGHEVEEVEHIAHNLKNVVTGKITAIDPHPNADKLVITQIDDGSQTHQIVTGAKNVSVGDIVPAALPGAVLHKGFKIKASELRGVPSNGMLCSEQELGIAEEADGIWLLPTNTPLGKDVVAYFGIKDSILDISILPNRGDCQSVFGLARDLAVYFNKPLKNIETNINTIKETSYTVSFTNEEPDRCYGYTGRFITHIEAVESPLFMRLRLQAMGVQPISFIVDVTNYVLLETGQPLHAFDGDKVNGKHVTCSATKNLKNKTFKALDGKDYSLESSDIAIAIDGKPEALAGVIGGEEASVTNQTSHIFLEAANFDSKTIRGMQSRHAIRTESSVRFEKGIDRLGIERASARAAHLLQTIANAQVHDLIVNESSNLLTQSASNEPSLQLVRIPFKYTDINQLTGLKLSEHDMNRTLTTLGFEIVSTKNETFAQVPTWREKDCVEWPCLAEEVLRFQGFEEVKPELPRQFVLPDKPSNERALAETLLTFFTQKGFQQVVTFPMVSPKIEPYQDLVIKNPISTEESVMRTHLGGSLLTVMDHNLKRQNQQVMIMEVGKGYHLENEKPTDTVFCEAVMTGPWFDGSYRSQVKGVGAHEFDVVKGIVENLHHALTTLFGDNGWHKPQSSSAKLRPTQYIESAYQTIEIKGQVIGEYGLLHPDYLDTFDIEKPVASIRIDVKALARIEKTLVKYRPYSKFPSTKRDIALIVPKTLPYEDIQLFVLKNKPKILKDIQVFDVFESEKIGQDKKSLGISFIYQADKKTLEDVEVNKHHDKLSNKLLAEFNVSTR